MVEAGMIIPGSANSKRKKRALVGESDDQGINVIVVAQRKSMIDSSPHAMQGAGSRRLQAA